MSKYYAVAVGRKPGIYTDWATCKTQVIGYHGAKYKSFMTKEEAEEFIKIKSKPVKIYVETEKESVTNMAVFCDGSAINNGKKGAIASAGIVIWGKPGTPLPNAIYGEMLSPKEHEQTNQRAELYAVMRACEELDARKITEADIYTDSMYTINCLTKWTPGWIKKGWKKANGDDVLHVDIIQPVYEWIQLHPKIKFHHISAHVDAKATEWPYIGNAVADWATHVARVGASSAPIASTAFGEIVPSLIKRWAS